MIYPALAALTRAWVTTTIASGLLLLALTAAQFCNDQVRLQTLQRAILLAGEQPPPDFDGGNGDNVVGSYATRAGYTGSR